jgi:hypothetical protein
MTVRPYYPRIQVHTASRNPLALVAAVRQALRRAHIASNEIERFTGEALGTTDPSSTRRICRRWVQVEN